MKLKFYAERNWMQNRVAIHIADQGSKSTGVATSISFTEIQEGEILPAPVLSLSIDEAQDLMDQLFAAGTRPSQAAGSAGQLDAVQYHLEDMRLLVFERNKS